ncbi:MAG: N-methyl-L-tryptophan oxidase [Hyphomicrobiales bacterium]|nr:N-methyl-L-tryptophan oxidase [Hyphomicrobiales bacterium]
MDSYDVIVIGTGGIGSAATYHAARRGARVLGLDRFPGGHANGSSHGETRIIRKAYFEHADYVPLLERAYALWNALEVASGETLFRRVGIVECGRTDGSIVPGVRQAARTHHLPLEDLRPVDFGGRIPFALSADMDAVFEEQAGFLFVERSVLAHLRLAEAAGARLAAGDEVTGWQASADGIVVETAHQRYQADKLIVTAGAWAAGLLADLAIPLFVRRKHLHWYACGAPQYQADNGCPCFFYETPDGLFYGFPEVDGGGVKVAEHTGGIDIADPLADNKAVDPQDRARIEDFVRTCLPGVSTTPLQHSVCYYTVSPDGHFIVDRHPQYGNVAFAAGLSGHGYKFATVIGEVLADLALDGTTSAPVGFLGAGRAALAR